MKKINKNAKKELGIRGKIRKNPNLAEFGL